MAPRIGIRHAALFGLLLIAYTLPVVAQDQQQILSRDSYASTHWGVNEGLPTNETRAIIQTRGGYIWIGTGFGVARFDGFQFEVYTQKNTPGLSGTEVTSLAEDREGGVWIGFQGEGIVRFADGKFSVPASCSPIAQSSVTDVFCDSTGFVYACTNDGLFCIRGDSGRFVDHLPEKPRSGFVAPDNTIYVSGYSIVRMTPGAQPKTLATTNTHNTYFRVVAEDSLSFFAAEINGIRRLRMRPGDSLVTEKEWPAPIPSAFLRDGRAGYLVGTRGKGIFRLDESGFSAPQGLSVLKGPGLHVHNLLRDSEGGIWATTNGGVFRFARSFFKTIGEPLGLPNEYAWLVRLTHDGTLWVGNGRDGMYRIKEGTSKLFLKKDGLPSDNITELFESSDGRLWFGGYEGEISVLQGNTFRRLDQLPGFRGGKVFSIVEDSTKKIWVGSGTGLYSFEGDRFAGHPISDPIGQGGVRIVVPDANGDVWFGGREHVRRLRNDTVTVFKPKNERGLYGVFAITLDSGRVWYGSYGSGLYLIRGDSATSMRSVCVGLGPRIMSIQEDNKGYLWINAERELQRVRKADLLSALDHPGHTVTMESYNHLDGLENIEFNFSSTHSSQMIADGRILYASTSGVVVVDPATAERPVKPPAVIIKRIIADDVEVDIRNPQLPAGTRRIRIDYTALQFQSPGRVRFRLRLGGVDRDWVESDGLHRSISYTNPGHGDFTFSVTANTNGGPWNPRVASVTFSVQPYFYELWSVRIVGALAAILLLVVGYNIRVRRIRARTRVLEEEIRRRLAVEKQLTDSLEEKTVMLKEIHHRVKNNMQVISSLMSLQLGASTEPMIQEALQESQARIRSMALVHETLYGSENFAAIGFREYLNRLIRQVSLANHRPGISISVEGEEVFLSLDQAIPAGLLMNELVTNSLKHAFPRGTEGKVEVGVRKINDATVELSVVDTGTGLPEEFELSKASTLGLRLVRSLTDQLDGTLSVDGNQGTKVTVQFGLGGAG
jgi:two-component sensor histidine kinase/ligand-binding sensor domain-containing protein